MRTKTLLALITFFSTGTFLAVAASPYGGNSVDARNKDGSVSATAEARHDGPAAATTPASTTLSAGDPAARDNTKAGTTGPSGRTVPLEPGDEPEDFLKKHIDEYYRFPDLPMEIKGPDLHKFLLEKAVLIYGETARRFPGHKKAPYAQFAVGEIERARNNTGAALTAYEAVINSFDENDYSDDARYRIAGIYFEKRQYEEAQENFFKVIDAYQRSDLVPKSYLMAARCYHEMLLYSKAIKTYNKVLEIFEGKRSRRDALMGLGDSYLSSEQYNDAIETYRTIMDEYPQTQAYDRAQFRLGTTYALKGSYPVARKVFREIIRGYDMNRYAAPAAYRMANTYYTEAKYAQAVQSYSTAMLRYPDYDGRMEAIANIADSYKHLLLYRNALLYYEDLLEHYKSKAETARSPAETDTLHDKIGKTLHAMGEIHIRNGRRKEALARLLEAKRFIVDESRTSDINYSMAECYYGLGWYREALEAYENFISSNPNSPDVLTSLFHGAESYQMIGYFEEAQEKYLELIRMEPEETSRPVEELKGEAVIRVGELYEEQQMLREEAEYYEQTLEKRYSFLDVARVLYRLGMVYERIGDLDAAVVVYQRVRNDYQDSQWFELAGLNLEIIKIKIKYREER